MLSVTKTYLPDKKKFLKYIDKIWESHVLTNNGSLLVALEEKLKHFTNCPNVLACANGTLVIQMALKAMNITKEVITTPFTYVATTNALLWEGCHPVFVDISPNGFTIDAEKIESAITDNTEAILATHVYGYPCDVERIEKIATKHNLKVIYDASNAFGTTYKGKSIFQFGDISTCSFHATKLFHTAEGGGLFINKTEYYDQLSLYRAFGHIYDEYLCMGINAKMSELHAAMGLCVLDDLDKIIAKRKKVFSWYDGQLIDRPGHAFGKSTLGGYNYAYYPVLFESQNELLEAIKRMANANIFPRRYFYPSLNKLSFIHNIYKCPISEEISERVLCVPLSHYITKKHVAKVCSLINSI